MEGIVIENMTRADMEAEIRACKALLAESDYETIKTVEGLLACETSAAIVAYIKAVPAEIKTVIGKRQTYRQTINDLEAALEHLPAVED